MKRDGFRRVVAFCAIATWCANTALGQVHNIVVQAEDFATTSDSGGSAGFLVDTDPFASGGPSNNYIETGRNRTADPPEVIAIYDVDFPTTDPYHLYTRANAQNDGANDSFWVGSTLGALAPPMAGDFTRLNDWQNAVARPDTRYAWVNHTTNTDVRSGASVQQTAGPYTPAAAGMQQFTIGGREDGFRIDAFVFSTRDDLSLGELDQLVNAPGDPPLPPDFTISAASRVRQPGHGGVGDGLRGRWWNQGSGGNMVAGGLDIIANNPADATFVASLIDFPRGPGNGSGGGTAIGTFLNPDQPVFRAGSGKDLDTNANNSVWDFQGFIDILASDDLDPGTPGVQVDFGIPSDDATHVVLGGTFQGGLGGPHINGTEVLLNDGGHGFDGPAPGPVRVTFEQAGAYPISLVLTQGTGGFGLELHSSLPGVNAGSFSDIPNTPLSSRLFRDLQQFLAPGDVNGDGVADRSDFNIILDNFLMSASSRSDGDINLDGRVDWHDFRLWKNAASAAPAAAAVPEPSTAALVWLLATMAALARRRPGR